MNQKEVICNRFLNLCRENIKELEIIDLMTGNELRNAKNSADIESEKIFLKLNKECKAMLIEQKEGVQYWKNRLNIIKKLENDKQFHNKQ